MPWAFGHRLFRWGKPGAGSLSRKKRSWKERRNPKKITVKILDGENVLEVREYPAEWRCSETEATVLSAECQMKPM